MNQLAGFLVIQLDAPPNCAFPARTRVAGSVHLMPEGPGRLGGDAGFLPE